MLAKTIITVADCLGANPGWRTLYTERKRVSNDYRRLSDSRHGLSSGGPRGGVNRHFLAFGLALLHHSFLWKVLDDLPHHTPDMISDGRQPRDCGQEG